MATDLLADGFWLMIAGMGTVFVFLTLLVIATILMSRLVLRFQPVAVDSDAGDGGNIPADSEEIAAIVAAIARYRNKGQ